MIVSFAPLRVSLILSRIEPLESDLESLLSVEVVSSLDVVVASLASSLAAVVASLASSLVVVVASLEGASVVASVVSSSTPVVASAHPSSFFSVVDGNMFYVELVNQYLTVAHFDNATAQAIMNEALKYQGWKYVYGGSNPNTSFDCSGLVQWCYGKAGISLPRTAQAQYDATQHLPLSQAKAGDLVFFHSTYNAGSYVTHVGIYVGNNQMYHAGDPIGYADLSSSYWQQHLIGAGRVKQ